MLWLVVWAQFTSPLYLAPSLSLAPARPVTDSDYHVAELKCTVEIVSPPACLSHLTAVCLEVGRMKERRIMRERRGDA